MPTNNGRSYISSLRRPMRRFDPQNSSPWTASSITGHQVDCCRPLCGHTRLRPGWISPAFFTSDSRFRVSIWPRPEASPTSPVVNPGLPRILARIVATWVCREPFALIAASAWKLVSGLSRVIPGCSAHRRSPSFQPQWLGGLPPPVLAHEPVVAR